MGTLAALIVPLEIFDAFNDVKLAPLPLKVPALNTLSLALYNRLSSWNNSLVPVPSPLWNINLLNVLSELSSVTLISAILILAEPSKFVPPIDLAVANLVAVEALPDKAPLNVVALIVFPSLLTTKLAVLADDVSSSLT